MNNRDKSQQGSQAPDTNPNIKTSFLFPMFSPENYLNMQKRFYNSDFAKNTTLMLSTPAFVAVSVYPLELIQARLQIFGKSKGTVAVNMMSMAGLKSFFDGLKAATKGSYAKNIVISNKEAVRTRIDTVVGPKEQPREEFTHEPQEAEFKEGQTYYPSFLARTFSTVLAAQMIGGMDTAATQYFANQKVLAAKGVSPLFSTYLDMLKFAKMGMGPRWYKNSLNAFFCIGMDTLVKEPMDRLFPASQYHPLVSPFMSVLLTGTMSGITLNGFEVVYKNMVSQADLKTMTTKTMRQAVTDLKNTGGNKAFMRGASLTSLITIIAYGAIKAASETINSFFEQGRAKIERDEFEMNSRKRAQAEVKQPPVVGTTADLTEKMKSLPVSQSANPSSVKVEEVTVKEEKAAVTEVKSEKPVSVVSSAKPMGVFKPVPQSVDNQSVEATEGKKAAQDEQPVSSVAAKKGN